MASSSDSEDDSFMAVDQEEAAPEGTMEQDEKAHPGLEAEEPRHNRSMSELPEEVLEYILSFLSPYQEHKTAALVCKQWYRLIKGVAHQCYHGFMKAVQEGNIQWESRTYPYPGTPITQRFSHRLSPARPQHPDCSAPLRCAPLQPDQQKCPDLQRLSGASSPWLLFSRSVLEGMETMPHSETESLTFMAAFTKNLKDPGVPDRMKKLDLNSDGRLDFQEFLILIGSLAIACHSSFMSAQKRV